jgi:hypothetical protein
MSYVLAIIIIALFVRFTLKFWDRHDLDDTGFTRLRFCLWVVKGILLPVLIWMLINAGVSPKYPPVLAHIHAAKLTGGHWVSSWLALILPVVFVATTFWAAATFIWLLALHLIEMDCSLSDVISGTILWWALLSPLVGFVLYLFGLAGTGLAVMLLLVPLVSEQLTLGNPRRKVINPVYKRALAKIKAEKFSAAEREVIRQLAKRDSDFEGWMMLAELYANHFNDLAEADRLVHELCRQTEITRAQMSEALHRLADWHLKLGRNAPAARQVLQEICEAFPATHFGDMAQKRISELTVA